jgi:hypothetical protein
MHVHPRDCLSYTIGWEGRSTLSYLRYCHKGLTGVPMFDVFDITDLKPEALHALIKTVALLSDLSEAMGYMMDPPVDVRESLWKTKGWYKPQSGSSPSFARP